MPFCISLWKDDIDVIGLREELIQWICVDDWKIWVCENVEIAEFVGWFVFLSTVYTLSILLNLSKNGIKSRNSVSDISSNHEATGT